ncbi:MAG: hypothetical protein ACKVQS_12940 [Fimbriimonadaceae bacterium]
MLATILLLGISQEIPITIRPSIIIDSTMTIEYERKPLQVKRGDRLYLSPGMQVTLSESKNPPYKIEFPDNQSISFDPGSKFVYLGDGTNDKEMILILSGGLFYDHPEPAVPFRYKRRVKSKTRALGTLGTKFKLDVEDRGSTIRNHVYKVYGSIEITYLQNESDITYLDNGMEFDKIDPAP